MYLHLDAAITAEPAVASSGTVKRLIAQHGASCQVRGCRASTPLPRGSRTALLRAGTAVCAPPSAQPLPSAPVQLRPICGDSHIACQVCWRGRWFRAECLAVYSTSILLRWLDWPDAEWPNFFVQVSAAPRPRGCARVGIASRSALPLQGVLSRM